MQTLPPTSTDGRSCSCRNVHQRHISVHSAARSLLKFRRRRRRHILLLLTICINWCQEQTESRTALSYLCSRIFASSKIFSTASSTNEQQRSCSHIPGGIDKRLRGKKASSTKMCSNDVQKINYALRCSKILCSIRPQGSFLHCTFFCSLSNNFITLPWNYYNYPYYNCFTATDFLRCRRANHFGVSNWKMSLPQALIRRKKRCLACKVQFAPNLLSTCYSKW